MLFRKLQRSYSAQCERVKADDCVASRFVFSLKL